MTEQEAIQKIRESKNVPKTYRNFSVELRNESVTIEAVKKDPDSLAHIPLESLTPAVIRTACQNNIFNLVKIPAAHLTETVYLHAMNANPALFTLIPKEKITHSMRKNMLDLDWSYLRNDFNFIQNAKDILTSFRGTDLYLEAFKKWNTYNHHNWNETILHTHNELLTDEVVDHILRESPESFQMIPEDMKTAERAMQLVYRDGCLLEFIPEFLLNKTLCNMAFRQNPQSISFIPPAWIDKEELMETVKQNPGVIEWIPFGKRTPELQQAAAQSGDIALASHLYDPNAVLTLIKNYRPDQHPYSSPQGILSLFNCRCVTEAFALELIEKVPSEYKRLTDQYPAFKQDRILAERAVSLSPGNLAYIQEEFKSDTLCYQAAKMDFQSFQHFPKRLFTAELCRKIVRQDFSGFAPGWIPKEQINRELSEIIARMALTQYRFKAAPFCVIPFPEILTEAIKHTPPGLAVEIYAHTSPTVRTPEMTREANKKAEQYIKAFPMGIAIIAEELRTPMVCLLAVQKEGEKAAFYVPKPVQEEKNLYSFARQIVPNNYQTLPIKALEERYRHFPPYLWDKYANKSLQYKKGRGI